MSGPAPFPGPVAVGGRPVRSRPLGPARASNRSDARSSSAVPGETVSGTVPRFGGPTRKPAGPTSGPGAAGNADRSDLDGIPRARTPVGKAAATAVRASPAGLGASPTTDEASPAGLDASPTTDEASPAGLGASPTTGEASSAGLHASSGSGEASSAGLHVSSDRGKATSALIACVSRRRGRELARGSGYHTATPTRRSRPTRSR